MCAVCLFPVTSAVCLLHCCYVVRTHHRNTRAVEISHIFLCPTFSAYPNGTVESSYANKQNDSLHVYSLRTHLVNRVYIVHIYI